MKKIIHSFKKINFCHLTFQAIIMTGLSLPVLSFAADFTVSGFSQIKDVKTFITTIIDTLTPLAIAAAGIYIVYAGYLFVSSTGDPKKLDTAKAAFYHAIFGTALIVGAAIIVKTIADTVSGL